MEYTSQAVTYSGVRKYAELCNHDQSVDAKGIVHTRRYRNARSEYTFYTKLPFSYKIASGCILVKVSIKKPQRMSSSCTYR